MDGWRNRQTEGQRPSHAPGLQATWVLVEDRQVRASLSRQYLEERIQKLELDKFKSP